MCRVAAASGEGNSFPSVPAFGWRGGPLAAPIVVLSGLAGLAEASLADGAGFLLADERPFRERRDRLGSPRGGRRPAGRVSSPADPSAGVNNSSYSS